MLALPVREPPHADCSGRPRGALPRIGQQDGGLLQPVHRVETAGSPCRRPSPSRVARGPEPGGHASWLPPWCASSSALRCAAAAIARPRGSRRRRSTELLVTRYRLATARVDAPSRRALSIPSRFRWLQTVHGRGTKAPSPRRFGNTLAVLRVMRAVVSVR